MLLLLVGFFLPLWLLLLLAFSLLLRLLLLLHLLCLSLAMNIRNAVLFEIHCWLNHPIVF